MNTMHDYGGMDGFTLPERDQGPILKEDWEKQVWGLAITVWAKDMHGYRGSSRADIVRRRDLSQSPAWNAAFAPCCASSAYRNSS